MRGLIAAGMLVLLGGCATPPGKLSESEFVWLNSSAVTPIEDVYSGLQNNARVCGGLLGGHPVEWYPGRKSAKVDMYQPALGGGRSDWVYGVIELLAKEQSTDIRIGVQRVYSNDSWKEQALAMIAEIEAAQPPSCKV